MQVAWNVCFVLGKYNEGLHIGMYKSKKFGKDKESIQSSTTPDQRFHMGKWQKHKHHKRESRDQPFSSRWPQGSNEQMQKDDKHKKWITQMIHKRSTAFEWSVKYFTGGFKPVSRRQPHP